MELDSIPQASSGGLEEATVHPSGGGNKEETHRISFCYGLMVFLGLALSLLTLTVLVVYVGVWSQHTLYGTVIEK